jgi:hypothetical protein
MDAAGELSRKYAIDHAMTFKPGLSFEGVRHDINPEMGLPAGPMPGMALMLVRFIVHREALRRESLGQLFRDEIGGTHVARLRDGWHAGQWCEIGKSAAQEPLSSLEGDMRQGA